MHAMRRALTFPGMRPSWVRGMTLGLVIGLAFLLVGDRGARAITVNPGIDPLSILDLQVKPNVLFIIDTSGSMKWPTDTDNFSVGDDDPASRVYQAKQAVNTVIQANSTKMNFGLATYNVLDANKTLNRTTDFDGDGIVDGPLVYVSADANAGQWLGTATTPGAVTGTGYFNGTSGTFLTYSPQTSAGIFASLMNTSPGNIAATYGYSNAYPPGCTPGTNCRYYMQSKLFRSGTLYRWNRAAATRSTGLVSTSSITCPLPPADLTGFNTDADGNGVDDNPRPCFQLQDNATGNIATYYYSSPLFQAASGQNACGGAAILNTVALCSGDNSAAISAKMGAAAPVDATGNPIGFPTAVPGGAATNLTGGFNFPVAGLREDQSTPLAGALDGIRVAGTPAFPAIQATGQRNFVILLSDGDDTCGAGTLDQNAVTAARAAQRLYDTFYGLNGETQDFRHGAETMFIAFASAINIGRSNVIAQGGSGATINTANPPATAATCPNGVTPTPTCRNAFTASNTQQLIDALNAALNQVSSSGTFSDQQSITESIYENVNLVPQASPSPPAPSPTPFDSLNPTNRYDTTVPVLLQSIFEMPGYNGHLRAFRNVSGASVMLWDAGDKLCQRVTGYKAKTSAGLPVAPCDIGGVAAPGITPGTGNMGNSNWPFNTGSGGSLTGGATIANIGNASATPNAKIRRRIFTTNQNGVNPNYTPGNLVNATSSSNPATWSAQVALWPPDAAVDPAFASPSYPAGSLDGKFGISTLTFAQMQTQYLACRKSANAGTGILPANCSVTTGGPPSIQTQLARKEVREIILAFTAGAQVALSGDGLPIRDASGNMLFKARNWIMAESTLAAPGIVAPPLQVQVATTQKAEYSLFRDGPRDGAGHSVNLIDSGFGLRNPDDDNTSASAADVNLKPSMTVVLHATNHMLHAFRGGPQSLSGSPPVCTQSASNECGGEELWAYVPYDQLGKLATRMQPQSRTNHTYVMASPVRFADVFVNGAFSKAFAGGTATGAGVWRVMMVVGRGAGGKSLTGMDVTVPGPFTTSSLSTRLPLVVWNRGNPDTNDGQPKTGANSYNNNTSAGAADYNAYLKMGETWSVPAVGFTTAANNPTARRLSTGVEYVAWVGSGYSDTAGEGTTFFALDAQTGDVIGDNNAATQAAHTLAAGTSFAAIPNALVANMAGFAAKPLSFNTQNVNPATEKVTSVYFPDLHSRVWRFDPDTPSTAPTLFTNVSGDGDQPMANGVGLINVDSDTTGLKPHVFFEAGNDRRVPLPTTSPFFRMYAYRDTTGTASQVFAPLDFPLNFRGTVQPATAFNANGKARVFYGGTRFNPAGTNCNSSFDSVIVALQGATGQAAYDLNSAGDDRFLQITGQRVNAVQVVGGQLVVDMGLGAQNPPPAPAPPATAPPAPGPANVSMVANVPGTVPFKIGSSVCR
jgi:hypothetical protein